MKHTRRIFSISGLIPLFYFIMHLTLYFASSFWIVDQSKYFFWITNINKRIFGNIYIEILLIFAPLTIHVLIGLRYMIKKSYFFHLHTHYTLRKANSLQRMTAWVLLLALTLHVVQMRIINHPQKVTIDKKEYFAVKIKPTDRIYKIADKLNVKIIKSAALEEPKALIAHANISSLNIIDPKITYAAAPSSTLAFLMMVINNFQSKLMVFLYTIFVLVASFHGFNGLWMFLIYFKVLKTHSMRVNVLKLCVVLMFIFFAFGLTPIWVNFLGSV